MHVCVHVSMCGTCFCVSTLDCGWEVFVMSLCVRSHICTHKGCVTTCPLSFPGATAPQAFLPPPVPRRPSSLQSPGEWWAVLGLPSIPPPLPPSPLITASATSSLASLLPLCLLPLCPFSSVCSLTQAWLCFPPTLHEPLNLDAAR